MAAYHQNLTDSVTAKNYFFSSIRINFKNYYIFRHKMCHICLTISRKCSTIIEYNYNWVYYFIFKATTKQSTLLLNIVKREQVAIWIEVIIKDFQ